MTSPRFPRSRTVAIAAALALLVAGEACAFQPAKPLRVLPRRDAGDQTAIGIEYVLIDKSRVVPAEADALAGMGLTAVKHYPDHVKWGEMQSGPKAKVDYSRLDDYVRVYQAAGFGELVICLKSHSRWGSREHGLLHADNPAPKPEYMDLYAAWIAGVVERYDGDGKGDMPGLRWPVRHVEIGAELSSYEPEPIEEYIGVLERAYKAAKAASPEVRIGHAAFLITTAFRDRPRPGESAYKSAFAAMNPRVNPEHSLASMRKLLDRPDIFDSVNFHALADPYEIEDTVAWLRYEMSRRNYTKPLIISDTIVTPFVGWGPATTCEGPRDKLGVIVQPATEADRCRLAKYFDSLFGDDETLAWTRAFVATDSVKRAVIASEQGVELIDLAFNIDLPLLTSRLMRAGAGVTAWAGALEMSGPRVVEKRPMYHAVRQLMGHLEGHRGIRRVPYQDGRVRVYEIAARGGTIRLAWFDPGKLILPEDGTPSLKARIATGDGTFRVERTITGMGQTAPEATTLTAAGGALDLTLTDVPVYVIPSTSTGSAPGHALPDAPKPGAARPGSPRHGAAAE